MKKMKIDIAHTQDDFFRLVRLREAVFVAEQGIPVEIEIDDDDGLAIHLIARSGREVVGTARLVSKGRTGKIGRMAVRKESRRTGIGTALIGFIKKISVEMALKELVLHAQEAAIPFYERLGFSPVGERFTEAGIPHRKMRFGVSPEITRRLSSRKK